VITDDSGLNIVALDNFPGVHSSRFMSNSPYEVRMKAILAMMKDLEDRRAYFACAATYYDIENNILVSIEERVYGTIAYEIRGSNGFGYDPFFIPDGYNQTFGELPPEVKNEISHRAKAFSRLFNHLLESSLI
jgi:XTP/dITP diphosphohydrolase